MRYYFAPMEGITDNIYRRVHHKHFPGADAYYMPFLSPTVHRQLTPREARELPCADSVGFYAVPQLLTKVSDDFLWAAQQCADRGYDEVNLNLGCPSGTVVAKGKGSGMLRDLDALDRFLNDIFSASPLPISVKTRIGVHDPAEFPAILEIYNRYPIRELTVHPRIRKAFYKGDVEMDAFRYAYEHSTTPLCYNGDIYSAAQAESIAVEFPNVKSVMIGRGLIGDPGMLTPGGTTIEKLEPFLEELLEEYLREFGGSRNAMFRLKENWGFLINLFDDHDKLKKRLFKATDIGEYRQIVREILHTLPHV